MYESIGYIFFKTIGKNVTSNKLVVKNLSYLERLVQSMHYCLLSHQTIEITSQQDFNDQVPNFGRKTKLFNIPLKQVSW